MTYRKTKAARLRLLTSLAREIEQKETELRALYKTREGLWTEDLHDPNPTNRNTQRDLARASNMHPATLSEHLNRKGLRPTKPAPTKRKRKTPPTKRTRNTT